MPSPVICQFFQDGLLIGSAICPSKLFSKGSEGFFSNGKIVLPDGRGYTAQVTLTRIGSGNEPEAVARATEAARLKAAKEADRAAKEAATKTRKPTPPQPTPSGVPHADWTPPALPAPNASQTALVGIPFAGSENAAVDNGKAIAEGVKIRRGK